MPRNQGIDMRRYLITALGLVTLLVLSTPSAQGQAYKSAAGWNAGVLFSTGLNDGADTSVELKPDPTWIASVHYDRWFGSGNIGFRARGGFSMPTIPWEQGDREIRVYMADIGVLLRPIVPDDGQTFLPFVGGGVGFINWGLGDGPPTTYAPAGANYPGEEGFDLVATASLGFDIVTPWRWGEGMMILRIEGRDHIQFSSPFEPVNSDSSDFGMIHNAAVVLGIHTGIGLLGEGH
ncbi:MAG: hypothetical protein PVJ76_02050 [Gemmatimonadota bacterium]|jgi:hypothetical protein